MGNLYFYIDQIIFVLVAFISVKEEVNATWAFRTYVVPGTIQSKLYHAWGAANIIIFGIVCAFAFKAGVLSFIYLVLLNGFIYWLLFDILFSIGINQKWDYLGSEASTDSKLKKYLGKNAGRNKAYLCILIIGLINLLFIIF